MNGCSAAVDRHRHRHVLDDEFMDRLHAEVGESEHTGRPDCLGHEIGRAADRNEIGGAMSLDGLDRRSALPIMTRRPVAASTVSVNASMRVDVVGPAGPTTSPRTAATGPT
jgi:hypothetical protein